MRECQNGRETREVDENILANKREDGQGKDRQQQQEEKEEVPQMADVVPVGLGRRGKHAESVRVFPDTSI